MPGDKSISHRSIMLGSIANGATEIRGFLTGVDCLSTISCFQSMGVEIRFCRTHNADPKADFYADFYTDFYTDFYADANADADSGPYSDAEHKHTDISILVRGRGLHGLAEPKETLDCGNSGTTARLISGILAGQTFGSTLTGDVSLRSRPMRRIMDPLTSMGADIKSLDGDNCLPLSIRPSSLHGIDYKSPVSSAQVKSCLLLAGLYADGMTSVTEPALSRTHTEMMLQYFGADITRQGLTVSIRPSEALCGRKVRIPGDISSAAYFIAAGLLVPGSRILIRGVGINPGRDGILRVCRAMGADISYENVISPDESWGEPQADLLVCYSHLRGIEIGGDIIPSLIDEIPVIAVLAAAAEGTTVIRDASELKFKESNRIRTIALGLRTLGIQVTETDDGMIIEGNGGKPFTGMSHDAAATQIPGTGAFVSGDPIIIDSFHDHRIAMSFAAASLITERETEILHAECADISYPGFYRDLRFLMPKT